MIDRIPDFGVHIAGTEAIHEVYQRSVFAVKVDCSVQAERREVENT